MIDKNESFSSWPSHIPTELYLQIREWVSDVNYWALLKTNKVKFQNVRYLTTQFRLDVSKVPFLIDEAYRNLILSQLSSPFHQLTLEFQESVRSFPLFEKYSILSHSSENLMDPLTLGEELSNRYSVYLNKNDFIESFSVHGLLNLRISYFSRLINVQGFADVKVLDLCRCDQVEDLSCLGNLEKINITECEKVKTLKGLGKVKELAFYYCSGLIDISDLTTENYTTRIVACNNITDIKPLSRVTNLETDLLQDWEDFELSNDNQEPRQLKKLFLFKSGLKRSAPLGFLQSLTMKDCHTIRALRGLKSVPVIEIENCNSLNDISDLGKNRSVTIINNNKIMNFTSLKNIPRVKLDRCVWFENGFHVENVKYLTISNCAIRELGMLNNCQQLELFYLKGISNFHGLYSIPTIILNMLDSNISFKGLGGNEVIKINFLGYEQLINELANNSSCFPMEWYEVFYEEIDHQYTLLRKREVPCNQELHKDS